MDRIFPRLRRVASFGLLLGALAPLIDLLHISIFGCIDRINITTSPDAHRIISSRLSFPIAKERLYIGTAR